MNIPLSIAVAGATTAGAGVAVGIAAPPDWAGIAQVITACGVLLGSFGTVIIGVIQARQKKDIEDTKALVEKVGVAVDGGMTKLLKASNAEAAAVATLDEQAKQREHKGIEDAATLKEKERASAAAAPAPSPAALSKEPALVEVTNPPTQPVNVKTGGGSE